MSADRVDSPWGPLSFFDGVPVPETVSTIYDALDLMRGIEVFLNAVPGASLVAMRRGMGADRDRGGAPVAVCGGRLLVSVRGRHGDRGGPDHGSGGKYLFLPPGYDGQVPDGYFT